MSEGDDGHTGQFPVTAHGGEVGHHALERLLAAAFGSPVLRERRGNPYQANTHFSKPLAERGHAEERLLRHVLLRQHDGPDLLAVIGQPHVSLGGAASLSGNAALQPYVPAVNGIRHGAKSALGEGQQHQ